MENSAKVEKRGRPKKAIVVVKPKKKYIKLNPTPSLILTSRTLKRTGKISITSYVYYLGEHSVKVATGVLLDSIEKWMPRSCEVLGNAYKTKLLREKKAEFAALVEELRRTNIYFDAQLLMDYFLKKVAWSKVLPTLLEGMSRYIDEIKQPRVDAQLITEFVVNRERRFVRFIQEFLLETYKRNDLAFAELNPAFGERLYTWLQTQKKYAPSFSRKIMHFVKATLNYAVANNWADRNPIAYQRWANSKKAVFALNEAELKRLETTPILETSLLVCRDVFLFQCYTGFSFADLSTLTASHLFQSNEGQWFIRKNREKTNETSIVPLLPRCLEILQKYEIHAKMNGVLLPVLSNQKYNQKLKVLAEVVGISRFALTSHVARKTCATMHLNKGLPLATVAGILGHATTRTTEQFYAVMREETIVKQVFDIYKTKAV